MLRRLALAAALFGLASFQAFAENHARPLKIGVVAPFSGPVAAWGSDVKNSLLFAQSQLGAKTLEFTFEDDRCLGKDAVTATQKLINIDKIDVAMFVCTESLLSAAPIVQRKQIPLVSPVATAASIAQIGDFVLRTYPEDGSAVRILLNHLSYRNRRLGVITEMRGYSAELLTTIRQESHKLGMQLMEEEFLSTSSDVRAQLVNLKQGRIDGLVVNPNSESTFAMVLKQTREILGSIPVFGIHFPGNPAFLVAAGKQAEGIVFVAAPRLSAELSLDGEALFDKYKQIYGPPQSSELVFASTYIAVDILRKSQQEWFGKISTSDLKHFIDGRIFKSIVGNIWFSPHGEIHGIEHGLYAIKAGQVVPLVND